MAAFLKIFFIVFLQQLMFLFSFGFAVSLNADGMFVLPSTVLIIYLIIYFKYSKTIYNQLKITKQLFNTYYFITWLIVGYLYTYLTLTENLIADILPKQPGLFSGMEYLLVPILLLIYLLIWSILIVGKYIFLKIKNN